MEFMCSGPDPSWNWNGRQWPLSWCICRTWLKIRVLFFLSYSKLLFFGKQWPSCFFLFFFFGNKERIWLIRDQNKLLFIILIPRLVRFLFFLHFWCEVRLQTTFFIRVSFLKETFQWETKIFETIED